MKLHATRDQPLSHYIDVAWKADLPPAVELPPSWEEVDEEAGRGIAFGFPLGVEAVPRIEVAGKFTLTLRPDAPDQVRKEFELRRAAEAGDQLAFALVRQIDRERLVAEEARRSAAAIPDWQREELTLFEDVARGELSPLEACVRLDSSPHAIERRMAKLR